MIPLLLAGLLAAASVADTPPDSLIVSADPGGIAGGEIPTYTMPPFRTEAPRWRPEPSLPGARTVLTRQWLERRHPLDTAEALLPVAGVRVTDAGDGATRMLSIRGLGPDRVAILQDGIPLNTAQGGGVDLAPLDLVNVDRVEITRGAAGALYGPHALGGAVNLIRRVRPAAGTSLHVLAGTHDRAQLRARSGFGSARWGGEISARVDRVTTPLDELTARAGGNAVAGRLSYHPRWAAGIEIAGETREDRRDVPGSTWFPTPGAERADVFTDFSAALRGARAGTGVLDLHVDRARMTRTYRDPSYPLGAVDDTHENVRTQATAAWRGGSEALALELLVDGARDALRSTTDGNVHRDRTGAAVHAVRSWSRWSVSGTLRGDALEGFAPHSTARLSATRIVFRNESARLAVRGGGGSSFRPPTFDDLFWPARASAAGNPDLRPERTRDLDLGVEFTHRASRFDVSGFYSRSRDLIQWTPGADGVWRPHNVGEARILGVEAEAGLGFRPGPWPQHVDASFTWMRAEDATDDPVTGGKQLVGRPTATMFLETGWELGAFSFAGGVRGVSRVPVTAAGTKWLDGYALVHARGDWNAAPGMRLELSVRNLLDTDYQDIRGYATSGREFLAGVRYAMGAEERP